MAGNRTRSTYEDLWQDAWHGELESPGASYRTRRRLFLKLVDSVFQPGVSVLDVGCGNGSLLADIARRHPDAGELIGVDVAEAAVAHAHQCVPGAAFHQSDPQTEPLPLDHPVDIVTACEVLEHVPDYQTVLKHMNAALKPRGHIVISVPHSMRFWGAHDEAVYHVRRFEHDELRNAVAAAGFEIVRSFTWGSGLYRLYYALVLNRVAPETTARQKSWPMRLAHSVLFRLFYLDDYLIDRGPGRMLFLVAKKP